MLNATTVRSSYDALLAANERVDERDMFGATDRKLAHAVELDHERNAVERLAELTEDELAVGVDDDLHVQEAANAPEQATKTMTDIESAKRPRKTKHRFK